MKPEERFNVQPSTSDQTITPREGYAFGGGTVRAVTADIDNNIVSNNIREGVTVLGVKGTLIEEKPNYRYMSEDVDRNGLRALGWTEDDILRYEQNTPHYPWQNDQYIVSEGNKALYGLDDPNPSSYKDDPTVTFVPNKNMDTYFNSGTFENMKYIKGLPFYNCTRTDMSNLFKGCSNLTTIPFFDTSNVTNMSYLFSGCSNLITVPQLNTSNVTNMAYLFEECSKLITVPQLNTSNVNDMDGMFYKCKSLTTIPQLNTSKVSNMNRMFVDCSNLTTIPLLDTSSVKYMSYMFYLCSNLTTIPQLDTSNVTGMINMFDCCTSLNSIPQLNTSKVSNMNYMFRKCQNLTTIPQLNTSSVEYMLFMFEKCTSLTTIPLLDTSNVTNMHGMFCGCTMLTSIPQLDTSNVTELRSMFEGCSQLKTIPQLNTSRAEYMDNMFDDCTGLKTVEGISFTSLAQDLKNLFGYRTSMPGLKRFIVNGRISVSIKDNYSIAALTAIDYDSVKSILTAADHTSNTYKKRLAFNRTMTDQNGELKALVSSCTSRRGWTITGLTLQ